MELNQLTPYICPVNAFAAIETDRGHATTVIAGDWVKMDDHPRCMILVKLGTLAQAVNLRIKQAVDNAGGSAKFIDSKLTVLHGALAARTLENKTFDDTNGHDVAANDDGEIVCIEMRHQALDKNNLFNYFQIYAAATTGTGDYLDVTYMFYSGDFTLNALAQDVDPTA